MRTALLVEDDRDQIREVLRVLEGADFAVTVAANYADGSRLMREAEGSFDLIVLDRRIPEKDGEDVLNAWGDLLFEESLVHATDSKVIVFTGHAELAQVMKTMRNRSRLVFCGTELDRVGVYEKEDAPAFEDDVRSYASVLRSIDDIDVSFVNSDDFSSTLDMCARRVALEYEAVHASVQVLAGGFSDSQVWRCELYGKQGEIARIVVKVGKTDTASGGLADQLAASRVAAVTRRFEGFAKGHSVCVMQDVDSNATTFGSLIRGGSYTEVADVVALLREAQGVPTHSKVPSLDEVVEPLGTWDKLTDIADHWGITMPSRTMAIPVHWGARHGDLHAENILVAEGHAVLIDFDSRCAGSTLLDPVTLLLSTLGHSSFQDYVGKWPSVEDIEAHFGTPELTFPPGLKELYDLVLELRDSAIRSHREFWALSLAYCIRQLKYEDVTSNDAVLQRVLALASKATGALK